MMLKDKCPFLMATKLNNEVDSKGRLYLFNSQTNSGFELEGLASIFVSKFDGVKSVQKITSELEEEFELEKGKFEKDIEGLINELKSNGLINFASSKGHE